MPLVALLLLSAVPCAPSLRPLAARWAVEQATFDCAHTGLTLTDQIPPAEPGTAALPMAVGAVAVAYNLVVAGDLRLTPEVLSSIYRGEISSWNDPRIAALNPGVTLPRTSLVVVREDPSALALLDLWLAKHGGAGAHAVQSKDGGAAAIARTEGAVGAIDATLARRSSVFIASLKNRDGAYVQPDMHSITRAAAGVRLPPDLRVSIVDAAGVDSYPLALFAYAVIPERVSQLPAVAQALRWAIHEGQRLLVPMGWAPLPGLLVRIVDERVGNLR